MLPASRTGRFCVKGWIRSLRCYSCWQDYSLFLRSSHVSCRFVTKAYASDIGIVRRQLVDKDLKYGPVFDRWFIVALELITGLKGCGIRDHARGQ